MKELLTQEPHTIESWSEHAQTPVGSSAIPMAQDIAKAVQDHKEDPWITLIERLWETIPYSDWVPMDVGEILSVSQHLWLDAVRHPLRLWTLSNDFVQQYTQVMTNSALALWGPDGERKLVIEPEAGDKRFNFPDWQQKPVFDALKQT